MTRFISGVALRLLALLITFALALGLFTWTKGMGWLSPFGITSQSSDSQVITAVERTQEVSLLSLGIQGIKNESQSTDIGGWVIPGSTNTVFLQYSFNAKLGIDGAGVDIARTGEHSYRISVPDFTLIGYEQPTFEVALEDNDFGVITPDIDQTEMVNEILNPEEQEKYVSDNRDILEDQTAVFYDSLITSIDPEAETTYEFSS